MLLVCLTVYRKYCVTTVEHNYSVVAMSVVCVFPVLVCVVVCVLNRNTVLCVPAVYSGKGLFLMSVCVCVLPCVCPWCNNNIVVRGYYFCVVFEGFPDSTTSLLSTVPTRSPSVPSF